jgi:hypothetical protein
MRTRRQWLHFLLCAIFAMGLLTCGDDEEEEDGAGLPKTYSVSGTVTRSTEPAGPDQCAPDPEVCDGRGDIYLTVMDECPASTGCFGEIIADVVISDADLSGEDGTVAFELTGIPDGTYYLSGFLDDAPNTVNPDSIAETGDLVFFGQASPACVEVTVAGGNVAEVNLDFNWIMPFALPIDDDECNEPDDDDSDPDIEDDGDTHTVTASVVRTVPPAFGGDGIGPLTLSLCSKCFSISGDSDDIVVKGKFVEEVDLSADGAVFTVEFEEMPNGVYYINGFIDDVTNATPENPFPGKGDLVSFGLIAPKCVVVVVDGADVTANPYELNMVMSFNLPGY